MRNRFFLSVSVSPRSISSLSLLALLCCLAYVPLLKLPLIEDDYPSLAQAQVLGAPSHVGALLFHSAFQARATSIWSMCLLWNLVGFTPWAYHFVSLLLHVLNTWLLYAICRSWTPMRQAAVWAAAFFAVAEGHQEAVLWFTAINELWMFLFGAAALLCWIERRRAGIFFFALALLSKESAVIFLPLFALASPDRNWRRWAPYAAGAALMTGSIFLGHSFRFSDGSFSLHAPFWITWPRGIGRVLWIWGWIAASIIWYFTAATPARRENPSIEIGKTRHLGMPAVISKLRLSSLLAFAWIVVSLVPYIFLTYSTEIPSRQTYLASAGLAMLVGLAMTTLDRRAAAVLAMLMLVHNVGYLWVRKRSQFLERTAPTEQLISLARRTSGPIWVKCFPRIPWIAQEAVHLGAGKPPSTLVWTSPAAPAVSFCYQPK